MIYPDVTVEEWCKRHPALRATLPALCICGREVLKLRPYLAQASLGLTSAEGCGCGRPRPYTASVVRDPELRDGLLKALSSL
jgi:hypothetical protein